MQPEYALAVGALEGLLPGVLALVPQGVVLAIKRQLAVAAPEALDAGAGGISGHGHLHGHNLHGPLWWHGPNRGNVTNNVLQSHACLYVVTRRLPACKRSTSRTMAHARRLHTTVAAVIPHESPARHALGHMRA